MSSHFLSDLELLRILVSVHRLLLLSLCLFASFLGFAGTAGIGNSFSLSFSLSELKIEQ